MKQDYIKFKLKNKKDYSNEFHDELLDICAEQSPLWKMMMQNIKDKSSAIEEYLALRIRKKPLWLPNFLCKFVLSKLVYLQYFK